MSFVFDDDHVIPSSSFWNHKEKPFHKRRITCFFLKNLPEKKDSTLASQKKCGLFDDDDNVWKF